MKRGNVLQIAYIPEELAHKDKVLVLKGEDGWKVLMAATHRMPEEAMPSYSQVYKHHRKATDI